MAMCAAVNRALDAGHRELIQPAYYQTVSRAVLADLLLGDQGMEIPLLDQRVACLQEVS
jgi:hypothetical protein